MIFFRYRIGRNLILFSSYLLAPAGPAEQYFQLCGNLKELDQSSKQAGRSEEGRKAGRQAILPEILGSNSSNTTVAAGSNSSINVVAANFRFISINYNFCCGSLLFLLSVFILWFSYYVSDIFCKF